MRKLPWSVLSLVTVFAGLNLVFVGCGSENSDDPVTGDDGGDGTASSTSSSSSGGTSTSSSGGSSGTTDGGGDGASDGAVPDGQGCILVGQTCANATDCCTKECLKSPGAALGQCAVGEGGVKCSGAGADCASATECCTNSCVGGKCSATQCKPDSPTAAACTTNAECCSGQCDTGGTGKCTAIAGGACRTEGNPCTANGDCCSKQCGAGGFCTNVSFCTQLGDVCADDYECCGGLCTKTGGATYGRCATVPISGGNACAPTGSICDGNGCDNGCCSLSCGPYGTSGVNICQPPSGCRPQYELCAASGDCCGGPGQPTGILSNGGIPSPIACVVPQGETLGRCEGEQCLRPGTVCKAPVGACGGTSNNCCEPLLPDGGGSNADCNKDPEKCCFRDALGIPRCRAVIGFDCGDGGVPPPGIKCASSADCCGKPCVNNACEATCVAKGGSCTNSADCCAPEPCVFPAGSTNGICGGVLQSDGGVTPPPPDSGTPPVDGGTPPTCALYGQTCSVAGDCCNGVPCTSGTCRFP